ncbi:RNA polymerase sigma-70 factor [Olivibacter sp. SDN3]|uniref:RNA polymerase sigma factor n=1 Tax=Olivibacter sp. SDN3 TaxID=2764720 RepID=UPI001651A6DF|nr:RNA polymerase sigma-70 factor [Olivibacter sp. SDN3]QNL49379.1 RNA polymerase sigma-70 factor [Olivibacter sp. SDN3]
MMTARGAIAAYLIEELQSGSEIAFRKIYDQLHPKIYRFIFSLLKDNNQSEEILQETFINLWLNKHKIDTQLPLYPYLYLTARRLTIDAFRKASNEHRLKERLQFLQGVSANDTEDKIMAADLQRITDELIDSLPRQQKIVFQLSRIDGLSYDEIAEKLHLSRNTVRNHLVCALKTLKTHFVKHDITYFFVIFFLLH